MMMIMMMMVVMMILMVMMMIIIILLASVLLQPIITTTPPSPSPLPPVPSPPWLLSGAVRDGIVHYTDYTGHPKHMARDEVAIDTVQGMGQEEGGHGRVDLRNVAPLKAHWAALLSGESRSSEGRR